MDSSPIRSESELSSGTVTHLFSLARQGDRAAFEPLWQHFFPRLVRLARTRLAGRVGSEADAEDAAQAALISFWSQLNSGAFLQDLCRESLWNLLATFTVRKVSRQIRRDATVRRGAGHVRCEADLASGQAIEERLSVLPTQELDVLAAELIESLPPDLQQIAMLRLMGTSTEEIAEQLDCTCRKIQRKLELVRLRWKGALGED